MKSRKLAVLSALAVGALVAGWESPAVAQSDTAVQLTYAAGSVSVQPGGTGEWVKLTRGNVLGQADNLWADQHARAELYIGSIALRMNGDTSLTLQKIDQPTKRLKLWLGTVIVHVPLGDDEIVKIETPNLLFKITQPGDYRLDVNVPGDETVATVWSGGAEAISGNFRYRIEAGHRAQLSGTDSLQVAMNPLSDPDDFDTWAFNRDQLGKPAESPDASADSDGSTEVADAGAASDSGVWTEDPGVWTELDAYPDLWVVLVNRGCPCGAPPPNVVVTTSPAGKPLPASPGPKPVHILRPLPVQGSTDRPKPPNFREPVAKTSEVQVSKPPEVQTHHEVQSHPAPAAESHHSSESPQKSDTHNDNQKH